MDIVYHRVSREAEHLKKTGQKPGCIRAIPGEREAWVILGVHCPIGGKRVQLPTSGHQ